MRKIVTKAMLVGAVLGVGVTSSASADGTWGANGNYCAGSLFITCFSINMTWTGFVVTLQVTNQVGEDDLIKAIGLFNLPCPTVTAQGLCDYVASGQSGYGNPPPHDLSDLPGARAYAVTNDQASMIGDGQTGIWFFTFSSSGWTQASFDQALAGASVGGHFISGPGGCSTKPIVNSDGTFNSGPLDPTCIPTVVPEPASMFLLATGLVGLAGAGYLRRRKRSG